MHVFKKTKTVVFFHQTFLEIISAFHIHFQKESFPTEHQKAFMDQQLYFAF